MEFCARAASLEKEAALPGEGILLLLRGAALVEDGSADGEGEAGLVSCREASQKARYISQKNQTSMHKQHFLMALLMSWSVLTADHSILGYSL